MSKSEGLVLRLGSLKQLQDEISFCYHLSTSKLGRCCWGDKEELRKFPSGPLSSEFVKPRTNRPCERDAYNMNRVTERGTRKGKLPQVLKV